MRGLFVFLSLLLISVLFAGCGSAPESASESVAPNVVFILIDDMGYADLGSYGAEHPATPNLDRLAAEGTRFTDFYVASPICSPSRVGITTGRYPTRYGVTGHFASREQNRRRGMPDYLPVEAPAIARGFQEAGYATAHFGKWHQGGGRDVDDAPHPSAYGFDESLVSFEGLGDRVLQRDHGLSDMSAELGQGEIQWEPKHRTTEIYVDRSIDFVRRNQDGRFYLHLWLNDVHDPFKPTEEQLAKFAEFSDEPYVQQYYAVVDEMDRQLGRLFDALDELGLAEETLVVAVSDNGPTAWPRYYQEGARPPGETGGFRGRKWSLYDGGIREPFLARWPGKIAAGAVNDSTTFMSIDFFATLYALAGLDVPSDAELDGEDLSDVLLGAERDRDEPLYWDYGRSDGLLQPGLEIDRSPHLAMRDGRWKFLINEDGTLPEMYDLEADPAESRNLVEEDGERAAVLRDRLIGWFRRTAKSQSSAR